jgi:hypothetical protein
MVSGDIDTCVAYRRVLSVAEAFSFGWQLAQSEPIDHSAVSVGSTPSPTDGSLVAGEHPKTSRTTAAVKTKVSIVYIVLLFMLPSFTLLVP